MPNKTIPLSVRVSHEDAEFLSALKINGATTPSEKLRALITAERRRMKGTRDYVAARVQTEELLRPVTVRLSDAEREHGVHSELITLIADWLPEVLAHYLTSTAEEDGDLSMEHMAEVEAGVADRLMRLCEAMLRLGVTERAPCYDPDAVRSRLGPVLELSQLIQTNHKPARRARRSKEQS